MFIGLTIDLFLGFLPVFGKVMVVLQNGLLNSIGHHQGFLLALLSIHLHPGNLGTMGPPLLLGVIHLKERISEWSTHSESFLYPVFQLHNTGKGVKLHGCRVSDGLCCLVHMIVRTCPVKDLHVKQAEKNQIIDLSLINPLKPLHPTDHVHPELIVE